MRNISEITVNGKPLQEILELHKKWLNDEEGGVKANLRSADLTYADLTSADLRFADLRFANLRFADLTSANLKSANLTFADLRSANLDFSCFPLWCGSFDIKIDKKIAAQIAYHFCRLKCDDAEVLEAQQAIKKLANQFHRVKECGEIK
jgi:hypothetical protein